MRSRWFVLAVGITVALAACGPAQGGSPVPSPAAATWQQLKPTVAPPPRDSGLGVYDSAMNRFLVAGGRSSCGGNDVTIFTDTWTFDGSAWTELHPADAAPNLAGFPAAYDASTKQAIAVIYQGCAEGSFTAIWDGTDWKVQPNGGADATTPMPAADGAMAYDPSLHAVILWTPDPPITFGGKPGSGPATWSWNGTTWSELTPAAQPPATLGPAVMTWDSAQQKLLLYGEHSRQLWSFDGTTWSQLHPAAGPSARVGASFVDDPSLGTVLLYGGSTPAQYSPATDPSQGGDQYTAGPPLGDLWSWDGSQWTELHPPTSPPARFFAQMAYDPALKGVVLFGGAVSTTTDSGDTWFFGAGSGSTP